MSKRLLVRGALYEYRAGFVSVALPDMFAEGRHRRAVRHKKSHAARACPLAGEAAGCPKFSCDETTGRLKRAENGSFY